MVGDHDAGGSVVDRAAGVVGAEDPLDQDGYAGRLDQPFEVLAAEGGIKVFRDVGGQPGAFHLGETPGGLGGGEVAHDEALRHAEAVALVAFADAPGLGIHREDQGGAPRLDRPLDHAGGAVAVALDVELEPDRAVRGRADLLDRHIRQGTEDEGNPGGASGTGCGGLSFRAGHLVEGRGGDDQRKGQFLPQQGGGGGALAHVAEHATVQAERVEGGAVLGEGDLVVGASRVVVVDHGGEAGLGGGLPFAVVEG
jgi:hypothetical protein